MLKEIKATYLSKSWLSKQQFVQGEISAAGIANVAFIDNNVPHKAWAGAQSIAPPVKWWEVHYTKQLREYVHEIDAITAKVRGYSDVAAATAQLKKLKNPAEVPHISPLPDEEYVLGPPPHLKHTGQQSTIQTLPALDPDHVHLVALHVTRALEDAFLIIGGYQNLEEPKSGVFEILARDPATHQNLENHDLSDFQHIVFGDDFFRERWGEIYEEMAYHIFKQCSAYEKWMERSIK